MFIYDLKIENFRNIIDEVFRPAENINIIFGDNANGKTSYIEAIYSVSNLKSFRTSNLYETINKDKNTSAIDCNFKNNNCSENIKLNINKKNKIFTRNNKKCNVDDYLWSLFSIVFKPEDIFLVNGPPGKRRELIDKAIFFTDKNYIKILKKYYKIVANKNINLKNNKTSEIEEWNSLIAKYSAIIVSKRIEYINRINKIFESEKEKFKSTYKISNQININECDLEKYFLEEIKKNIDKEIKYKYSIIGAHRQNIEFYIDNKELKVFGSQGQKRTFILLFRSSQIVDFGHINNFYPILLLDDMASELDDYNKKLFFEIILNFKGQTFITTTDKKLFSNSDKVKYFCVENGKINPFFYKENK